MFQFSPKPQKERKLRVFFFFSGGFTQQFFVFVVSDHVFVPNGWETKNNSGRKTPKKKKERDFVRIDCHHVINNQ